LEWNGENSPNMFNSFQPVTWRWWGNFFFNRGTENLEE